jgi:hypothetical protein
MIQKNLKEKFLNLINKHYKMLLNKDKVLLIKILMVINSNLIQKEKKFKKFVIQSSKKEWVKEDMVMTKRIVTILMMIFDV